MLNLLAKIGLVFAGSTASIFYYFEDVKCPESLLK